MRVGAALAIPWLSDLSACREAVIELDSAGLDHVTVPTNLANADAGRYPDLPPFLYTSVMRDPFVFFASLAPVTAQIRFRTAVLVLPVWPTMIVAKQAADLAILSGGRFQLGVGIGAGQNEFRAYGQQLRDTGQRLEEQVEVLKRLWTEPTVSYHGQFHDIDGLGLGEEGLPADPIPIWLGCSAKELPLRRTARLGDGWLPFPQATEDDIAQLHAYEQEAGRAPGAVTVSARVVTGDDVVEQAEQQRAIGATELTIAAASQADSEAFELDLRGGIEAILEAAATLRRAGILDDQSP